MFRRFCDVILSSLTGALIEKIQSPARGHLTLTYFGNGKKRMLWLKHERQKPFCFVTTPQGAGTTPPAFVMRLRKYAVGSRIASVVPQYLRRKLWFLLTGADSQGPAGKNAWLCLDLREGASLHFLDPEETPAEDEMRWPKNSEIMAALRDWQEWPVLTPDLRRTLAALEERDQWALVGDLQAGGGDIFLYADEAGEICRASAWPLAPVQSRGLREESGEDAQSLLERAGRDIVQAGLARSNAKALALPGQKKIAKLNKLLAKLENEEKRLISMRARKKDAQLLRDNLWQLARDYRGSEIVLDDHRIALDARFGLRENMERLFHLAKRGERGLAMLEGRKKAILEELASLGGASDAGHLPGQDDPKTKSPLLSLKNSLPRNVQAFVSSDGYLLLRGRDARGNRAARKLAHPHDIWLHVEHGPGAHVIIRRRHGGEVVPENTLEEAGSLAASKSWLKDAASAGIVYAEARHISPMRNAPPGTMRIAKIITSRQVRIRPELEEKLAENTGGSDAGSDHR